VSEYLVSLLGMIFCRVLFLKAFLIAFKSFGMLALHGFEAVYLFVDGICLLNCVIRVEVSTFVFVVP